MNTIHHKILATVIIMLTSVGLLACTPDEPPQVAIINSIDQIVLPGIEAFKAGLAERGYVEGETIVYDTQTFKLGETEQVTAAVQAAVDRQVDLIYAIGLPAALAAQEATATQKIPVLFGVADPITAGLVDNLRQPGGHMTGVASGAVSSESDGRRLEWLKKIKPDVQQIYVTYDPDNPIMGRNLETVLDAAEKLDVEVVVDAFSSQAELDVAMADLPDDMEVFFALNDRRLIPHVPELIKLSLERKFLFSTPVLDITRAGGLMAFGPDYTVGGNQTARLADQILKGGDPGEIPVEEHEIFLNVNLKTAEAIGLEIPDEVLEASYEIIR